MESVPEDLMSTLYPFQVGKSGGGSVGRGYDKRESSNADEMGGRMDGDRKGGCQRGLTSDSGRTKPVFSCVLILPPLLSQKRGESEGDRRCMKHVTPENAESGQSQVARTKSRLLRFRDEVCT